ncbi:hypothetical protein VE04_02575 [Pseudogymnoascus sp. 24MN13]|nr:hypothetical protein VE04_02575 [Pseudogymnoascus sp. 24MN13]
MAGRRDDYDDRDHLRGPPRGAPVELAERRAPLRSRDLEDLWRTTRGRAARPPDV